MTKVLFVLTSGKETPEKSRMALVMVSRQVNAKRYEDVKVLLYGTAEEFVATGEGPIAEAFETLIKSGAIDSACVAIAKMYNVDEKLKSKGVELFPFGERLAKYVNDGYQVITL